MGPGAAKQINNLKGMSMNWRSKLLAVILMLVFAASAAAQQTGDPNDPDNEEDRQAAPYTPSYTYIGDRYRIGVGLDSEFDVTGEFLAAFAETDSSSWIGEGWLGREGAGGLKLNYHWLTGAETEEGPDGDVYVDGRVAKLFLAADQNQHSDRKLTFGGGMETESMFWSLYGMSAISDERLVSRDESVEEMIVTGQVDGRDFTRMDALERVVDWYEAPYEWGVGARLGRYFDDAMIRIRGGLDYEDGDFSSSQTTASFSIDKFFADTPHSLSLRTSYARKSGDFVDDRNDVRGSLVYSYSFGGNHRPRREYEEREVTVDQPDDAEPQYDERMVATEVTLSDEATFAFDSSELRPAARATLDQIVEEIEEGGLVSTLEVYGHTCDIGTESYNQGLSERRARSVVDYLVSRGIDESDIRYEGRGELDPRHPNDSEENRSRNRRVELSFTTERETTERIEVGPDEPATEIRRVEIPTEAAWIRRALRNPVRHKRIVDYYRYQEVSETVTEGEPVFDNEPPTANDNSFTVETDSADNELDVLANDTDPDGDELTIIDVSAPSNGQVEIAGGLLLYTPSSGFTGTDTFTYTIDDGFGGEDTATVTVTVVPEGQAAEAQDVDAMTERTQAVDIDVLAEASNPDNLDLELVSVGQASDGTVEIVNGQVRYTPDQLFYGDDSFEFTITDGLGGTSTATVFMDVAFANQAPVAVPDSATTPADTPVEVDVLANDFDPDGDPIELVDVQRVYGSSPGTAEMNVEAGTITFTIGEDCSGLNIWRYTITDPFGATDTATVTIYREGSEDAEEGDECVSGDFQVTGW